MGSHKNKLILTYTVMFKFLILANALVAIVKMVSPTEPERILDHCYTDRKSCLKECKECITDGSVCKANSIFDQKFLSNKNLVTCRNAMDQMIAWKRNTRPSSMLCFNYYTAMVNLKDAGSILLDGR